MRGQGRVYRPKDTAYWWLDYTLAGVRRRESSGKTKWKDAQDVLDTRRGDRKSGKLVGDPASVTLHTLRALVEQRYTLDGRRTLVRVQRTLDHLERVIGMDTPAMQIDPDSYAEGRLAEGAQRSTVNQELAALRRGFRLAVKKHLLTVMPVFELPKVHNERQGFFEAGELAALVLELPAELRPVVQFAHMTGWRVHKEILPLTWDAVDWEGQVIRIAAAATKGGEARTFPFGCAPDLKALLEAQWKARDGLCVFHRNGKRIRDLRGAWEKACKRAGLVGRIPHDLRRSAARDMRRAGISEGEIMKLCGWRTRSMFDRYNIIDEADLAAAVAKRFNGIEPAKKPPVEQSAA